jgi:sugar lactone lactonase YvrE
LGSPVLQRGLERAGFTAPPPDTVAATASSGTQLDVTWVGRSNFETGFQVELSTDNNTFATVASVSAGAASAAVAVQPGTVYYVRVRTTSVAGLSGYRDVVQATTPAAVIVTAQPSSLVVTTGQPALFTVDATGAAPLSFQWFKKGVALAGATAATLELGNVQSVDAGDYSVTVSNGAGSTVSQSATLTVQPAFFPHPTSIAADGAGNLLVGDPSQQTIQRINSASQVALLAGATGLAGSADGAGAAARFNQPGGIVVAADGTVTVADTANATLRRITAAGAVTTWVGSATNRGNNDGTGSAATFSSPRGLALGSDGAVYVADAMNHTIRRVSSSAAVATFAGTAGAAGAADGSGATVRFNFPTDVALDSSGNLYVADTTNNTIRRVTPVGVVTTLAGLAGVSGADDGWGAHALFNRPGGLALDAGGNLYVADTGNSTIRRITPAGVVSTFAGLPGVAGLRDGRGSGAYFNQPEAITVGPGGDLYVADTGNATIRRIAPDGQVTTPVLSAAPSPPPDTGGGTVTPPTGGGSGGGGGAVGGWLGGALAILVGLRILRRGRGPGQLALLR